MEFVLLLFALSVPFWLVGVVADRQLLPGLPVVDALVAFCPVAAATILVHREKRSTKMLLARAFDYRRIRAKVWYLPTVLLAPAVAVVAYGLMRATHEPLPPPHIPVLAAPLMLLGFFVGGIGEEVGWTGYATERLRASRTGLETGILVGLAWAAWHVPQLVQLHRTPAWICWWCAGTVASRVLIVWIYENTGRSVFAAVSFHAMQNLSWQLFPTGAAQWDPRLNALVLLLVVVIVVGIWGPRTLSSVRPN